MTCEAHLGMISARWGIVMALSESKLSMLTYELLLLRLSFGRQFET